MLAIISSILIFILSFVAIWRTYTKAGEPGWKSIIPFYSIYVMFKIARVKQILFWLSFILVYVGIILAVFIQLPGLILTVVASTVLLISLLYCYVKVFERFGLKAIGWVFVAFLLPVLGFAVIAFNPYIEYDFE